MAKMGFRNTQPIYYAQYQRRNANIDLDGYETGESTVSYETPVLLNANVVDKTSTIAKEYFGEDLNYKCVILTDINCPIKEDTAIWIDTGNPIEDETIPYNYQVADINKSLHYKAIAVKRITKHEVSRQPLQ